MRVSPYGVYKLSMIVLVGWALLDAGAGVGWMVVGQAITTILFMLYEINEGI